MPRRTRGRALIVQSGGPTPVINRSLAGLVLEALERDAFDGILGAVRGWDGLLAGDLIDLARQPRRLWPAIARMPGAALGSSRRNLAPAHVDGALAVLRRHDVRFLFSIGGNDSAENAHRLAEAARASGQPLAVVGVPKTVDNDLPETDHCPGYGSAARFIALATLGAGRDAEALSAAAPVTVLEVMGRNAGWLAAASALVRRDERDAPHAVCTPERPVDEGRLLAAIEEAVRRFGYAVAVVAETVRGPRGPLAASGAPDQVDEFGHAYYPSPGAYLARRLAQRLKVRVRFEKPGTIQRSMVACVSRTDAAEAELVGRVAVGHALAGRSDCMVTLVREQERPYRCGTGLAPLDAIAGRERLLPEAFLDTATGLPNEAFIDYARPLVGPLPRVARLIYRGVR